MVFVVCACVQFVGTKYLTGGGRGGKEFFLEMKSHKAGYKGGLRKKLCLQREKSLVATTFLAGNNLSPLGCAAICNRCAHFQLHYVGVWFFFHFLVALTHHNHF